ncbi:uncharacterized protein BJX67DRAFT_142944 [Aspergillus lucknowensis]|uniref:Uncharacterized protein n=1 Tax=Aspergillus lucknowensis TaxID=176173 RepID=A0ABR4LP06_9EURO
MAHSAIGRLLRCQTPSTIRRSTNNLTQKRSWSTAAIPSWAATPSPELDRALFRFRDELFIPHALNPEQRKLIYKPKYANKLKENPITVSVGPNDESYHLRPLNKHNLPSKKDARAVISLMHKTGNWSNLVPFLTGLRESGFRFEPQHKEWLVRKALSSNGLGYLSECFKQPHKTGLNLKDASLVQQLFFGLHVLAERNKFEGPGFEKVHRLARIFTRLMEAPEHVVHDLANDPKRKLSVIGVLLELSAARAVDLGGKDDNGEVLAYARRLLAGWRLQRSEIEWGDWVALDHRLQAIVPIYNGMKLALQVNEVASDITISQTLETQLKELGILIAEIKIMAPKRVQRKATIGYAQARRLHQN